MCWCLSVGNAKTAVGSQGGFPCVVRKVDSLPSVQQANNHTLRRDIIYFIFAQRWVLGGNSIKLAHHTKEQ